MISFLVEFSLIVGNNKANQLFKNDRKLCEITLAGSQMFKEFKAAYKEYSLGRWGTCKAMLDNLLTVFPNDGPSRSIYNVMKENEFVAPSDWRGFRALTEK